MVDWHNIKEILMTGMEPKDVIGFEEVPLVNQENYPPEDTFPENELYCYLLQSSKEHNDQCKTATDRTPSKKTYRLSEVALSPCNWVMYHLKDGVERVFKTKELMLIPKNTELPMDFVQK